MTSGRVARDVNGVVDNIDAAYVTQHISEEGQQLAYAVQCVEAVAGHASLAGLAQLDFGAAPEPRMAAALDGVYACIVHATPAQLVVLYAMIRVLGEHNPNVFRWLLERDTTHILMHKLIHNVWAGHYAAQAGAMMEHDAEVRAPALPLPAERLGPRPPSSSRSPHILSSVETHALAVLCECLCSIRLCKADIRVMTPSFVDHLLTSMSLHESREHSALCMHVLLALHEQCMMSRHASQLLTHIQHRMHNSKTFSENLVFLLNKTPSTTLAGCRFHLLVLKLLGAMFALPETASYFYLNDLKVLVDVFLRELSALPDTFDLLRQAYLCVMYGLLTQTQLCTEAYKRTHITRLLTTMVHASQVYDTSEHTLALVQYCLDAEWCVGITPEGTTLVAPIRGGDAHAALLTREVSENKTHFHAEPNDDLIRHLLILECIQATAAAIACLTGTYAGDLASVLWTEFDRSGDADVDDAAHELDVLVLETWSRRPSTDSTRSEDVQRRPPPRPPRPPRSDLTCASMPDLHASSTSTPPSPSATPRRRAPDIPVRERTRESSSLRSYLRRHWHDSPAFARRLLHRSRVTTHDEFDTPPRRRPAPPPPPPPST